jgi:acyl dehydratase
MVAYMSQASTKMCQSLPGTVVSYGYDKIRFPAPVFIGDTVTVTYEIASLDVPARKTFGRITVTNQRGEVVAAGIHVLKWVA